MNQNEMKEIVVAALLFFLLLIILAFVVPYAYHYVNTGPEDSSINTSISDVPGGGLLTGLAFVLGLITLVIVVIIKLTDLI